ncbi:methyltransferase [Streptomyces sp. NPDC059382]|uniref:methyltransferase n=1 Tax=Streptomyces sp. NPDC059382 TaxID=3346816 RepID=UPI0036A94985
MAKLTTAQATQHRKANDLTMLDRALTLDEQEFVLDHWMEAGTARLDGAFFTPAGLAQDLSIEVYGERIIDLCAGIGRLAWHCRNLLNARHNGEARELVCVEKDPEYVRVGRKILPEATWILGDVFDVPSMGLGRFDMAIGNPPYGAVARAGRNAPRYTGSRFEYHVIDIAAEVARNGVFLIPQESAPFRLSGRPYYTQERTEQYNRFERQTGIALEAGCGVDTSGYVDEWRDAAPRTEIVVADLAERKAPAATAVRSVEARSWPAMSAVEFTTRPKATQVAMFDTGDDKATGSIGLFDI